MLLLTDRPSEARRLQRVVGAVEPCTLVGPGEAAAASPEHGLIICDAAARDPAAAAALAAAIARHRAGSAVPVLLLARDDGPSAVAQAEAVGATAVLPSGVSDAQILFTARRLAAARRAPQPAEADPAVRAAMREACARFDEVYGAARAGRPVGAAALAEGGDALIDAVKRGRIDAWVDVVRAYDDSTYQHCLLVSGLAAGFALRLGMSSKGQRLVAQAALVHDIGKAGIPQAILNKAGPLTGPEMAVMRTHAQAGHGLLVRQGGFDPQLLDIVRHHHECLDGSGYPDGLSGAQVSPLVRLMTICDIYAALIERRVYKPPAPPRDALAILAGMGGKLDAGLLRIFAGMVARPS